MSLDQDLAILAFLGLVSGGILAWAVAFATDPGEPPVTPPGLPLDARATVRHDD